MTYRNITEIKKANKEAGHYWFSPATVKAFDARVETHIIEGRYWVESTTNADDTDREYKLVVAADSGDVQYVRKPGTLDIYRFGSRTEAIDALSEYLAEQKEMTGYVNQ